MPEGYSHELVVVTTGVLVLFFVLTPIVTIALVHNRCWRDHGTGRS
jgi:hypothetical protein